VSEYVELGDVPDISFAGLELPLEVDLLLGVLMGLVGLLFCFLWRGGRRRAHSGFRGAIFDAELAGVTLLVTGFTRCCVAVVDAIRPDPLILGLGACGRAAAG
jgi:hypothetical protein